MIRRFVVLRADRQDCEENGKPGRSYWPRGPDRAGGVAGPVFKIYHEFRFKIINVVYKTPEWLGDLLVRAK